jgi:hypothetical protein
MGDILHELPFWWLGAAQQLVAKSARLDQDARRGGEATPSASVATTNNNEHAATTLT